jgi:hypothetical protein
VDGVREETLAWWASAAIITRSWTVLAADNVTL